MLKRAVASLRKVTPHLVGAVLNQVDVRSKAYYGYAYKGREAKAVGRAPAPKGATTTPEVSDASLT